MVSLLMVVNSDKHYWFCDIWSNFSGDDCIMNGWKKEFAFVFGVLLQSLINAILGIVGFVIGLIVVIVTVKLFNG